MVHFSSKRGCNAIFFTERDMFQNNDIARLILRIGVGGLMLFHGVHKVIYGADGVLKIFAANGLPTFLGYGVYLGEVIAPILLVIGYYSRIAALLIAGTMIVAIATTKGFFPIELTAQGAPTIELPLLFLFGSLALFFSGPGKYSINRR